MISEIFERQVSLLGISCQERLLSSTVLIVGVGGLGCVVAENLVRLGVKRLYLVDKDRVSPSNLNRQFLFTPEDIGKSKVKVAAEKLKKLRKEVEIIPKEEVIDETFEIPPGVDLVVDCLDDFESRFCLERAALKQGLPVIHGGIDGFFGQVGTFLAGDSPKFSDVFKGIKSHPEPVQAIAPTCSVVGAIQALEVVKLICGVKSNLLGKLLIVDLLTLDFSVVEVR